MPIQNASDTQKIDYLWKKIVYGAAKTDIAGNIDATQEPVASPLQIRSDKILQDSRSIPSIIPVSNSSVVNIYPTTFPVECISTAGIPTPTLTWQTGQTFWVPPEFGSTYQIKVYIAPSGNAANVASKGTQVFATGSGSNDLWVFDYQSGILNFNSNNTPYSGGSPISFTGNSVYISGAVYSGKFGIGNLTYVDSNITSNTDITISTLNNANIFLSAGGGGIVHIQGTDAFSIPSGNILARPNDPDVGYLRFNTELALLEYWNGSSWIFDSPAEITSQIINPDGTSNAYVLTSNATTAGVIVNINGTVQQPFTAYNVVGNTNIVFTEIPLTTDTVEVRTIATGVVAIDGLTFNDTRVYLDSANVNITGNVLPSANVTYSLGSETLQWKDLWVSGNSIYIGGSELTVANGQLSINGNTVGSAVTYSNVNVKAYTETMGFANYSNVNVAAYTQTQSFTNYSNVNVAAYTTTQSYTNYSNVNVAAYTQTQSYTNYSNVNLTAYLGGNVAIGTAGAISGAFHTFVGNITQTSSGGAVYINTTGNVVAAALSAGGLSTIGGVTLNIGAIFRNGGETIVYGGGQATTRTLIRLGNGQGMVLYGSGSAGAPAAQTTGILIHGGDGNVQIRAPSTASGSNRIQMQAQLVEIQGNLTPVGNLVYNIGNVTNQWNTVYADTVSASLVNTSGNILSTGLSVFGNTRIGSLATPGALHTIIGNVDVTGAGTEYFNIGGNVMAIQGSFGSINTSGNVVATGGVFNALNVNGNLTVTTAYAVPSANAASSLGSSATRWNFVYGVTGSFLSVNANYADLAEKYLADASYSSGTVVDFGGVEEVTMSTDDMSLRVAGVISTNPGYVMNEGLEGENVVLLALTGRVPTKVTGPIRKGDMLVSNGDGRARAETLPRVGSVIGKAIEDFDGEDGIIEIVIGIR